MPMKYSWQILLGLALVAFSVFAYMLHYAIFRDGRHILIYLIGDLAFLPVQILFVTLIVDRLLNKREKMALLKKMNMVIGVFFSELGRSLLESFKGFDSKAGDLGKVLLQAAGWTEKDFSEAAARCRAHEPGIELRTGDLEQLRSFLLAKRDFLRHIVGDINRAYALLLVQWLAYLAHLKSDYPYLYSLAVRMNPFDPAASPGIR